MKHRALLAGLLLSLLAYPLHAETLRVSAVTVVGAQRVSTAYVTSLLPFREGSLYASMDALDSEVKWTRQRLIAALHCYDVDISVSDPVEGDIEMTVGVIESVIGKAVVAGQTFLMFDNVPWTGMASGLAVDTASQALALGPAGIFPFGILLVPSGNFLAYQQFGVSVALVPSLFLLPEISLSVPVRYLHVFPDQQSAGGEEANVEAHLAVDFSWMEWAFGVGLRNEIALTQSLLGSDWQGIRDDMLVLFRPWEHLSIQLAGSLVQRYGAGPRWDSPQLFGVGGLRGASDPGLSPQNGVLTASLSIRLTDLIVLDFQAIRPSINPVLYLDAGNYESAPFALDWTAVTMIAGGGLELELPVPIGMSFQLYGGLDLSRKTWGVTFQVTAR